MGMKRSPDHVLSFFLAELGTTGSIDGSDRLLVRGKYQPKYIESLLRKYSGESVICSMCRNLDTELSRDPNTRLWYMNCKACRSARSVAAIKAGFHATAKCVAPAPRPPPPRPRPLTATYPRTPTSRRGDRKKAREALK